MVSLYRIIPLLLLLLCGPANTQAQFWLDFESGVVLGTAYNTLRIPNAGGTRVDLARDLSVKPTPFYRIRAGYTLADRHTISVLYAPLTVRYKGAFAQSVNYNSIIFQARQPLTVDYTFNSYRLTYRYDFVRSNRWRIGVGLTAKIRDASVQFRNEQQATRFDDLGFVPLLNLLVSYRPAPRWQLLLEGDALGSRFGRAEDVFTGIVWQPVPTIGLKAGYRVVEGGADVESIYNFTWINYASAAVRISL